MLCGSGTAASLRTWPLKPDHPGVSCRSPAVGHVRLADNRTSCHTRSLLCDSFLIDGSTVVRSSAAPATRAGPTRLLDLQCNNRNAVKVKHTCLSHGNTGKYIASEMVWVEKQFVVLEMMLIVHIRNRDTRQKMLQEAHAKGSMVACRSQIQAYPTNLHHSSPSLLISIHFRAQSVGDILR